MRRPLHNQMNCEGCMSIFSRLTWLFRATLITSFMLFHLRKQPRVGGIIRASSLIVRSMIYNRRLKWQSATDSHFSSRLHTSAKAVVPERTGGFKDPDEAPSQVWKAEIRVNALIVHKKGLKKGKREGNKRGLLPCSPVMESLKLCKQSGPRKQKFVRWRPCSLSQTWNDFMKKI